MYHYQPLKDYLSAQKAPTVVMSYDQIEKLLGRPLPPSAKGDSCRQWWANTETHSQAKAWLDAGRRAKLDVLRRIVTFWSDDRPSTTASDVIALTRRALNSAALRLLEDVAEETGGDLGDAAIALLNQAALTRRRRTLEWFADHTTTSSERAVDLIRAERDAR